MFNLSKPEGRDPFECSDTEGERFAPDLVGAAALASLVGAPALASLAGAPRPPWLGPRPPFPRPLDPVFLVDDDGPCDPRPPLVLFFLGAGADGVLGLLVWTVLVTSIGLPFLSNSVVVVFTLIGCGFPPV